jgi:dihydrofolate reductase
MEAGFTRLTKARVESLRAGLKQRDISDPERRGLVLRIAPPGSKIWLFRYKFAGKPAPARARSLPGDDLGAGAYGSPGAPGPAGSRGRPIVDRFIACPKARFDFLPEGGGETHGYDEFMASVDALVIGRKWPYAGKRVVVLSSQPLDLSAVRGGMVEQMAGPPAAINAKVAESGAQHLYMSMEESDSKVCARRVIQRLIITRAPVLIGDGIPLFGTLPSDIQLRHVTTQQTRAAYLKPRT